MRYIELVAWMYVDTVLYACTCSCTVDRPLSLKRGSCVDTDNMYTMCSTMLGKSCK